MHSSAFPVPPGSFEACFSSRTVLLHVILRTEDEINFEDAEEQLDEHAAGNGAVNDAADEVSEDPLVQALGEPTSGSPSYMAARELLSEMSRSMEDLENSLSARQKVQA